MKSLFRNNFLWGFLVALSFAIWYPIFYRVPEAGCAAAPGVAPFTYGYYIDIPMILAFIFVMGIVLDGVCRAFKLPKVYPVLQFVFGLMIMYVGMEHDYPMCNVKPWQLSMLQSFLTFFLPTIVTFLYVRKNTHAAK